MEGILRTSSLDKKNADFTFLTKWDSSPKQMNKTDLDVFAHHVGPDHKAVCELLVGISKPKPTRWS